MRVLFRTILLMLFFQFVVLGELQSSEIETDLSLSGFFDLQYQSLQEANDTFGMGIFEVDFSSELSESMRFEGAVTLEEGEVNLGQTILDIVLYPNLLGIQAGLLDVPFGVDYRFFGAPNRKFVTPPLTTEVMMAGGWGDIGLNFYGGLKWLRYSLFVINGNAQHQSHYLGEVVTPDNTYVDNNSGKTIGGHLGLFSKGGLEIGVSYMEGPYLDDNNHEKLVRAGFDAQFTFHPIVFRKEDVIFRGEYLLGKEALIGNHANKHKGYYVQLVGYFLKKAYVGIRYGGWLPQYDANKNGKGGDDVLNRLTVVVGYPMRENVLLRLEVQKNMEQKDVKVKNDMVTTQAVVSF